MKKLLLEVSQQFFKSYFTIKKTSPSFSANSIDQAHEYYDEIVKTDGGIIAILDNEAAILEWEVRRLCISEMINKQGI